ncbi:hypothetical protein OU426_08940 [Frigidibacter sp. RF13]|uniref:hypothetical protein n=1 Tax=Frigidibacter sp. RF13 TaxID=2997340 RepID=UPI002270CD69|nr:hypothetical protein [Frigidibacter sp. RF13]MCY1126979.1 hypothetical protein [Frigidibacter sp. RF13]
MSPDQIASLFTRPDGTYAFARWERPIAPVVFGVKDETLATIKGAIKAVTATAGHPLVETDPELGANLMVFFFRDWQEVADLPGIADLVPGLDRLAPRLGREAADQYRHFRFEEDGAIRAAFVFFQMGGALADMPAADLGLTVAVQSLLLWSESAFRTRSPLVAADAQVTVHPEIAAVLRAAYDPVMPAIATDPSHALRLFARMRR